MPTSVLKTPTPLTDDPAQEEDLLQRYQERMERLSQQIRVIKICTGAGFLTTVGVGQYFMTKVTEEFSQFTDSVACREYTLPRDEKSSDPKGWIRGNTKIGPVSEVTTSYLQGDFEVEIRIQSVNKDHSHSCIRISHGLNKLVTDLKQQGARQQRAGNLRDEVRRICVEDECTCFCEPIKGQSKTTKTYSGQPIHKNFNDLERSQHWSDEKWMSTMAKGGGNKNIFQYCTDPLGQEILYLRALQGHSGRNLIDPSLQDKCINSEQFPRVHLSHGMCNQFTLHHEFWIDNRRTKFEQKTDGFLHVCGSNEQGT